jgi:carboxypeptidase Taq
MEQKLNQLKARLARIADLSGARSVLSWDQQVMMPVGGAVARGDQMGTISGLAHEMFVDEEVGALLDELYQEYAGNAYDSDEVSLVRVARRDYEKRVKIPTDLVVEMAKTAAMGRQAWQQARAENNFAIFAPLLEKTVGLQVRLADILGSKSGNPYDALLDRFEPGLTFEYIDGVFSGLKKSLVDLIEQIAANRDRVSDDVLKRDYPEAAQIAISSEMAQALGYDFNRGRLDKSAHPFTSGGIHDARITTRVDDHFLPSCVMAVIHEAGHGMHMQSIDEALYRTGLDTFGLAIAESQSRFFENVIGRSRAFWTYWYPKLQATFPHLSDTPMETFYKAINKSAPSLIRVEADEVTYGLHIMLRFEIENELINQRIKVADLPALWNERMQSYLGVTPPNDTDGVLQDIHWSQGGFGYFPDYLLGSILASQLWDAFKREQPDIEERIACGEFAPLLLWQREAIMKHGNKFTFPEIAERATGQSLSWEPYMNYLRAKFGDVYGLRAKGH